MGWAIFRADFRQQLLHDKYHLKALLLILRSSPKGERLEG
jgi:hypothetical protein